MDNPKDLNMDLPATLKTAIVGTCDDAHIGTHLPLNPTVSELEMKNYQLSAELPSSSNSFATLETVSCGDQTGPAVFVDGYMEPHATYTYQEPGFDENSLWTRYQHNQYGVYNQGQYNWILTTDHEHQNYPPISYLTADEMYDYSENAYTCPDVSPPMELNLTRKKHNSQADCNRQYIKRPPNAFMIYRREQRPHVVAETNITDCAAVNKILGQRWKMMTKKEQAKYYEEAKRERAIHAQLYPGWSAKDNYGNMPKRVRRKTSKDDGD